MSVIFTIFSARDDKIDTGPVEERPYLQLSNGSRISLNVQYIRTTYFYDAENPYPTDITVVSSRNELEQYYERNRNLIYDGNGNLMPDEIFLDAIERYSDNYFTDNCLVIVRVTEGSGSIRHELLERIDENGNIVIKRLMPEIGTDDMATWSILIELDNDYKREQYQVLLVD